jgi:hypothetical protein
VYMLASLPLVARTCPLPQALSTLPENHTGMWARKLQSAVPAKLIGLSVDLSGSLQPELRLPHKQRTT